MITENYPLYGTHADVKTLDAHVDNRLISRKPHPTMSDVVIYNYTQRAMFENTWDEHIVQARGLVVNHADGEIIARPLPKFFNHDQIASLLWNDSFEVTTKLDGSMFLYTPYTKWGQPVSATRGAFESPQAQEGRRILDAKYSHVSFENGVTYVFEMIHPSHRIVVDYGTMEDIVLLAMVRTADGTELSLDDAPVGLAVVERHTFANIGSADDLLALTQDNAEGFVVRFADGTRAKVKFLEYKHLHALITGTSSKSVWRVLRDGQDVASLFEKVPDEFADFVREWIEKLTTQRDAIIADGKSYYEQAAKNYPDRKGQAIAIQGSTRNNSPERAIAMMYMAGQPERALKYAWQAVEPEHVGPPFADEG